PRRLPPLIRCTKRRYTAGRPGRPAVFWDLSVRTCERGGSWRSGGHRRVQRGVLGGEPGPARAQLTTTPGASDEHQRERERHRQTLGAYQREPHEAADETAAPLTIELAERATKAAHE